MKKLLFSVFACLAFVACDRVDTLKPDPNENVPDAVVNSIKASFKDASDLTVIILKQNELYEVDFVAEKSNYEAIVSAQGDMKELRIQAKTLDVTPTIQAYLDANFPGATLNQIDEDLDPIDKTTVVGYWVYISTTDAKTYQLYFDALGAFVSQTEITSSNVSKYDISESELPNEIAMYLANSFYGGHTFNYGVVIIIDNVTTYMISVTYNGLIYYYEFNATGAVLYLNSFDPNASTNPGGGSSTFNDYTDVSQIPTTISDYLNQNFAGWQFQKGFEESDNGTPIRYVVVILVGNTMYYVEFDGTMQFVGATQY